MYPRIITQRIHALIDYPVAIALISLPFLLGLGSSNSLALWLSVWVGIAALILTVFTNHETGLVPVIPYGVHLVVDFLVGVLFLAAPFIMGFAGMDAWYYWANATAVLMVVTMHQASSRQVLTA